MAKLDLATATPLRPGWTPAAPLWPVDLTSDPTLRCSFVLLRTKWGEVPFAEFEKRMSSDLLRLSDAEVWEKWTSSYAGSSTGSAISVRGRKQRLDKDALRVKTIPDDAYGLAHDNLVL